MAGRQGRTDDASPKVVVSVKLSEATFSTQVREIQELIQMQS